MSNQVASLETKRAASVRYGEPAGCGGNPTQHDIVHMASDVRLVIGATPESNASESSVAAMKRATRRMLERLLNKGRSTLNLISLTDRDQSRDCGTEENHWQEI